MQVRKYLASSLQEAMNRVRAELGKDAVIIQTQKIRVGGFWGLFGRPMIEVTAAVESKTEVAAAIGQTAPAELFSIQEEMGAMVAMVGRMVRRLETPQDLAELPPEVRETYAILTSAGVEEDLAHDLVSRAASKAKAGKATDSRKAVRGLIEEILGEPRTIEAEPSQRKKVALLGPTGVGKTTTMAKLAAYYTLGRKLNVALITADTYRIAAVEQLKTYSEIIGVPLFVVFTPKELEDTMKKNQHRDLILLDTAGRSHRNLPQMAELKAFLEVFKPDESYLVMSLTTADRDAQELADAYQTIGYDRLLFTKLDESSCRGLLLNVVARARRPLSYITTGQNVPDDIEVANPAKITKLILGE